MTETLHSNIGLVSERLASRSSVETELCGGGECGRGFKAEIDTSAPFESVKEAVSRFGGGGFWKPGQNSKLNEAENHELEHIDIAKVEEQAAALQKELMSKEKDTLAVLKELEATKSMVEQLKSKLQKEESSAPSTPYSISKANHFTIEDEKENNPDIGDAINRKREDSTGEQEDGKGGDNCLKDVSSTPAGLILMELAQAKLNLVRTTDDLSEIRASVESYNKKIEKERFSLERTRERLSSNSSKISSLEEELRRTQMKLDMVKDGDGKELSAELQRLNAEAEQFKKMGEAARAEIMRAMSEIEQTKASINTAEVRLIAAQKMKEAARAAEAVALAEIKALEKSTSSSIIPAEDPETVALTPEAYSSLMNRAQGAEESTNKKVEDAMVQIDEANLSKSEILKRVEEAMEEVKTSKKALEEALNRVEEANKAKLAVEEALRKWRSENGQRRRSSSVQNSTKFKTSGPSSLQRRDSRTLVDVNGVDLASGSDMVTPALKPTLSIGQILSRKLLVTEEFESGRGSGAKRKVSLGQMLGRQSNGDIWSVWKVEKENNGGGGGGSGKKLPMKRKKFGFARLSVLLAKQNKRKKKPTSTAR